MFRSKATAEESTATAGLGKASGCSDIKFSGEYLAKREKNINFVLEIHRNT